MFWLGPPARLVPGPNGPNGPNQASIVAHLRAPRRESGVANRRSGGRRRGRFVATGGSTKTFLDGNVQACARKSRERLVNDDVVLTWKVNVHNNQVARRHDQQWPQQCHHQCRLPEECRLWKLENPTPSRPREPAHRHGPKWRGGFPERCR